MARKSTPSRFSQARRSLWRRGGALTLSLGLASAAGCGGDFDTTRQIPKRGTLGEELYGLLCDRVGAQALRSDITGASYRNVCHADEDGKFSNKVDQSKLAPLTRNAIDSKGKAVSVETQKTNRLYRILRVETLATHRADLVKAFDTAFPDKKIPIKEYSTNDAGECLPKDGVDTQFLTQMDQTLKGFVDLYRDETIPSLTRALGKTLNEIQADGDVQAAFARIDARDGYRPATVALGVSRPALAYPRLFELTNTLFRLLANDSDPYNPSGKIDPKNPKWIGNRKPIAGKAAPQFQNILTVLHHELRVPSESTVAGPLEVENDATIPHRQILSRPRGSLELASAILLAEDSSFGDTQERPLVFRDLRGFATVVRENGSLPFPFVDAGGGIPEVDDLGQFVTQDGNPIPAPFRITEETGVKRDDQGRLPIYRYRNVGDSLLTTVVKDIRPLFNPDPNSGKDVLMQALAGAPLLFGPRMNDAGAKKEYPETGKGDLKVAKYTLNYQGFNGNAAPAVDLVYALGQLLARPEMADALNMIRKVVVEHPQIAARLTGLGLRLKSIADNHPEAKIPAASTFWDDMIDVVIKVVQVPGLVEDLVYAFGDKKTLDLEPVFAAYMSYRDILTYQRDSNDKQNVNKLNGPVFNESKMSVSPIGTPVNRALPDSGDNRSILQRFMQLLHDANGLSACTKAGAKVRIPLNSVLEPIIPFNLKVNGYVEYPGIASIVCPLIGAPMPPSSGLPRCGVIRFENVLELLLDVVLNQAKFDVRDECLRKLMENQAITGIVGGADAFLESISGIKGFNLNPSVAGISRLVYFDAPYDQWGGYSGDGYYTQTGDFLKGILDPIPTTVCPIKPYTDTDGKVLNLRECTSFADTMRARDRNSLYPVAELGFVDAIQPLAQAFAKYQKPLLFAELFDTMHLHWGSKAQTKDECDSSLPKDNARWCAQDGLVTYEPLLAEMIQSDLFPTASELVNILKNTTIDHCENVDSATGKCTSTSQRDGVQVLSEVVRILLDPKRNSGLTDRFGKKSVVRNDGSKNDQVTPIYLLVDALKGVDKAFADYSAFNPDGEDKLKPWRNARSNLVDTFFSVQGQGTSAQFRNPAITKAMPVLIDVLQSQVDAHCDGRLEGVSCQWAEKDLAKNLEESISGPLFAASMDLLEAIRTDPEARKEVQRFIIYLIDETSANSAQYNTLVALADALQTLGDDVNLDPIYQVLSRAVAPDEVDATTGAVSQKGLVSALLDVLTRIFGRAYSESGVAECRSELDPNQTIAQLLQHLVTPDKDSERAPIEVVLSAIADVNRKTPGADAKLNGEDFANISKEVSEFLLDEGSGLEQVYEVIRVATEGQ